jgi:hypothetical protein
MPGEYKAPIFKDTAFNCPYCGVYAHQRWAGAVRYTTEGLVVDIIIVDISICQRCSYQAIWVKEKLLYPESTTAPLPNIDMPEDVKEDYLEAASISLKSLREEETLLSLIIKKLFISLSQTSQKLD